MVGTTHVTCNLDDIYNEGYNAGVIAANSRKGIYYREIYNLNYAQSVSFSIVDIYANWRNISINNITVQIVAGLYMATSGINSSPVGLMSVTYDPNSGVINVTPQDNSYEDKFFHGTAAFRIAIVA